MDSRHSTHGITRRNTEPNINTYLFGAENATRVEQLAQIDREIMRSEDGIVKLVLQRAFLKRRRNSLFPAVNLPNELLALIFEFACLPICTEFDDEYGDGISYSPGEEALGLSIGMGAVTPVFLGSICSRWRHVVQGASQLWSNLVVHVNNRYAEDQAFLLQSWLTRSAARPLSIRVIEDDSGGQDSGEDWGIDVTPRCIIDILVAHSHQWHIIDFFLPSSWSHALSRVKHNLPVLTKATLRLAENSPSMARINAFALAPQLREVRLVGYSTSNVVLPYAQLHSLHEEYFAIQGCLDALHLCDDLRVCQFEQVYRGSQPVFARPVRHDMLESLELLIDDSRELDALFGAMTLPNLTELVLSLSDEGFLLDPLIPLIQRSKCRLQTVHLVGFTPPEHKLLNFLREVPMLRVLMLINPVAQLGSKLTQRLLKLLDLETTQQAAGDQGALRHEENVQKAGLVPLLERLEYQGAIEFTSHQFAEFLAGRWRTGKAPADQVPDPPHPSSTPRISLPPASSIPWSFVTGSPPGSPHHFASESRPQTPISSTRVQLRSVTFTTPKKIKFDSEDAKVVLSMMQEGLHLELLADPNAD
ncbi:hypothetical protein CVT26_009556 [Gymnopilus dilepis]|uniref:F-box domain-containing protein n=1 Tax=Gymnopilus dilepis TaxID=231916 RepID=A0A409VKD4_9AGAR|nr:hypothetical protein CVT26_009556 [Gymnopilus dilepis]